MKVRVILDQNLEMSDNTTAYNALGAADVQVHWANPTYAATHQKTITVDGDDVGDHDAEPRVRGLRRRAATSP